MSLSHLSWRHMRIVAWNLRSGTDAKWDHLVGLRPDVAILPEVSRAPKRLQADLFGSEPPFWHWVGANPAKGLAVATWGSRSGTLAAEPGGRWSVGVRWGKVVVLGIWSCPTNGRYWLEVERSLEAHVRWLARRGQHAIVAGDFNVEMRVGSERRSAGMSRLFSRFAELGLISAYHHQRGQPFGLADEPTYYHYGHRERPFHIDFCFLSKGLLERLQSVEVGSYETWIESGLSDHVPVVVTLADQ